MSVLVSLAPETYRGDALDGFTGTSDFTLGNAQAMMWLAQLAYETDHEATLSVVLPKFRLGLRLLGRNGRIAGLLQRKPGFIVAAGHAATFVTFAGTDPLKIGDWFNDFTLALAPNVLHKGFAEAVDSVWNDIEAAIKSRGAGEQPVFFTGHSMGGALANIAALRALDAGIRAAAVYTFGGPRAGGQDFFDGYTLQLGDRTFRLVHCDDIVASVPPSLAGDFRHVGRMLHCQRGSTFEGSTLAPNTDNDPDPILTGLTALLDIKLGVPNIATLLALDPRRFDQSDAIPIVLRDHVPASYFRALSMPLA